MDSTPNYKCGEIFITYQGKYSYNCIICREWFDSIEYYEDHYMVQHFESKDLYGEDGESFPIKIEPITDYDFELIKSEVNSDHVDFVNTEHCIRVNVMNKSKKTFKDDKDDYSDITDTNEVLVTIEDSIDSRPDTESESFLLEWSNSDREINIEENNETQSETESNENDVNETNLIIEKQNIKDDIVTCQICYYSCTSSDLLYHVLQHKSNGISPLCNKIVNNLNKHGKINHANYMQNRNTTKLEEFLHETQIRKRTDKKEPIPCKYCNKNFFLVNALEQHEKLHEKRLLNCKFCNKSYKDLRFLRYHMRKHTGERPFKCEQCSAAFATKDNLNTHNIYKHTDTYNFSCTYEECNKKFKTKELRKRHIKNIHLKVFGYQCDICGQKFTTSSRLSIHRVKNHIEPDDWPYKCEFCSKPFILQCKLKEHMNCHTGDKPFKCDLCDQRFMKRRALSAHKKRHKT